MVRNRARLATDDLVRLVLVLVVVWLGLQVLGEFLGTLLGPLGPFQPIVTLVVVVVVVLYALKRL